MTTTNGGGTGVQEMGSDEQLLEELIEGSEGEKFDDDSENLDNEDPGAEELDSDILDAEDEDEQDDDTFLDPEGGQSDPADDEDPC